MVAELPFTRCFIPNTIAALASVIGPVLLFLMAVGLVFTQAYLVTPQWKHYDDIFRGHYNIRGIFCDLIVLLLGMCIAGMLKN